MGSFVCVKSDVVIEHCERLIQEIEKERQKRDEATIESRRLKKYFFWSEKVETPEEARKRLLKSDALTLMRIGFPSSYAWGSLSTARKLIRIAKLSNRVFLSAEDASMIDI